MAKVGGLRNKPGEEPKAAVKAEADENARREEEGHQRGE